MSVFLLQADASSLPLADGSAPQGLSDKRIKLADVGQANRADRLAGLFEPATVVLFAGLGGACIGIEDAYVRGGHRDKYVDLCVNHWDVAVRVHELNHPMTQHLHADVWEVDPAKVLPGRRIGYLHASPDCTDFSKAKGGMPKRKHIRALADVVLVWAAKRRPTVITLENVEEFLQWGPLTHKKCVRGRKWAWIGRRVDTDKPVITIPGPRMNSAAAGPWIAEQEDAGWSVEPHLMPDPAQRGKEFKRWKGALEALGYVVEAKELRACDHGTPTTRKRLFVVARCDGKKIVWPEKTHGTESKDADRKNSGAAKLEDSASTPLRFDSSTGDFVHDDERKCGGLSNGEGRRRRVGENSRKSRARRCLKPYATAAGCIDWSQPMLSIFATRAEARLWSKEVNKSRPAHDRVGIPQRPLRPKTQGRLAGGLLKWILDAAEPFIVKTVSEPLSTVITSGGQHGAVSVIYLAAYYGEGSGKTGHTPAEPMPTVVSHDRFAAVSVDSTPHWIFTAKALARAKRVANWARKLLGKKVANHLLWVTDEAGKRFALLILSLEGAIHIVTDIAMRMLRPRELARAQGFADDYVIDRTIDGTWVSKADQVKLIGNSVCRQVMSAIAYVNVVAQGVMDDAREAVTA